ncbi:MULTISPECIES: zinc-binding alcohol dehydrogenase family protein [unclassified Janthinobacterium]|uniref:zinc-binding alcohol dehydrogenase family protein n=1 Tax=unclassified Janthinobacterium TaxID=2610881 RepID=UPI00160ECA50|nr:MULTISPECIES: zinc-binding alcohol dehydrogenase family protein [unclassified Janthinobacterium]MBB5609120.1 zinc-binding alcohol dehydrogenase family protein [Janthinobacterium sp. S3T4]MBB5614150.1 zinc-binding alcohol dehydrogenase family protein [Janthinobacterium sp. S3M3]
MKAIAYHHSLPITDADALLDIELPTPVATGRDLLVAVHAISVNPVDTKVRKNRQPKEGQPEVLGWDAAGVVTAVGSDVSLFKVGDKVWYAGAINRPGSNSQFQLVDERIVGHMPASLDFAAAAALPLTAITAWELLFERLQISRDRNLTGKSLLVIGAAGGVGSVLVQLARQMTGVTIIGTASRADTSAWVTGLGAHHVIDHSQPLAAEITRLGLPPVDYVISLNQTDSHFDQIVELIAPQGKFALIDDPEHIDVRKFKGKSVSLHWELMFTRSLFQTPDMIKQHALLDELAQLVDAGTIKTTVAERFGAINAANLKRAHALLESNTAKGKIVLEGF